MLSGIIFITYGALQKLNLRCITGHKESSDNREADGYEDQTILSTLKDSNKKLSALDYGAMH